MSEMEEQVYSSDPNKQVYEGPDLTDGGNTQTKAEDDDEVDMEEPNPVKILSAENLSQWKREIEGRGITSRPGDFFIATSDGHSTVPSSPRSRVSDQEPKRAPARTMSQSSIHSQRSMPSRASFVSQNQNTVQRPMTTEPELSNTNYVPNISMLNSSPRVPNNSMAVVAKRSLLPASNNSTAPGPNNLIAPVPGPIPPETPVDYQLEKDHKFLPNDISGERAQSAVGCRTRIPRMNAMQKDDENIVFPTRSQDSFRMRRARSMDALRSQSQPNLGRQQFQGPPVASPITGRMPPPIHVKYMNAPHQPNQPQLIFYPGPRNGPPVPPNRFQGPSQIQAPPQVPSQASEYAKQMIKERNKLHEQVQNLQSQAQAQAQDHAEERSQLEAKLQKVKVELFDLQARTEAQADAQAQTEAQAKLLAIEKAHLQSQAVQYQSQLQAQAQAQAQERAISTNQTMKLTQELTRVQTQLQTIGKADPGAADKTSQQNLDLAREQAQAQATGFHGAPAPSTWQPPQPVPQPSPQPRKAPPTQPPPTPPRHTVDATSAYSKPKGPSDPSQVPRMAMYGGPASNPQEEQRAQEQARAQAQLQATGYHGAPSPSSWPSPQPQPQSPPQPYRPQSPPQTIQASQYKPPSHVATHFQDQPQHRSPQIEPLTPNQNFIADLNRLQSTSPCGRNGTIYPVVDAAPQNSYHEPGQPIPDSLNESQSLSQSWNQLQQGPENGFNAHAPQIQQMGYGLQDSFQTSMNSPEEARYLYPQPSLGRVEEPQMPPNVDPSPQIPYMIPGAPSTAPPSTGPYPVADRSGNGMQWNQYHIPSSSSPMSAHQMARANFSSQQTRPPQAKPESWGRTPVPELARRMKSTDSMEGDARSVMSQDSFYSSADNFHHIPSGASVGSFGLSMDNPDRVEVSEDTNYIPTISQKSTSLAGHGWSRKYTPSVREYDSYLVSSPQYRPPQYQNYTSRSPHQKSQGNPSLTTTTITPKPHHEVFSPVRRTPSYLNNYVPSDSGSLSGWNQLSDSDAPRSLRAKSLDSGSNYGSRNIHL